MTELLQRDITDDAAQSAFLNYLTKLDEVAKLEPCGLYTLYTATAEEYPLEHSYVVACTTGAHRKYYFRRCEFNTWMPWQQIKLDIEDVPIIPVVWKGRLFLFWLKIVQQAPAHPATSPPDHQDEHHISDLTFSEVQSKAQNFAGNSLNQSVRPQAILCWSEYYNGEWQSTKTSDPNQPTSFLSANEYLPSTEEWQLERAVMLLFAGTLDSLPNNTMVIEAGLAYGDYSLVSGGLSWMLFCTDA